MTKPLALLVIALLAAPRATHAQAAPLEPGARVRGQAPAVGVKRFDATVMAHTGDTLVIANDGIVRRLPMQGIRRLELFRGRDRRLGARQGTIGGALFGFLLGGYTGLIASAHSRQCSEPGTQPPTEPCARAPWSRGELWAYTGGFTAVGALSGLGAGLVVPMNRWERLSTSRTSLAPVPGGIGVRITLGH